MTVPGLVVVGVSWGALGATCELLAALPEDFKLPLLLVLHRSRHSSAERLHAVVRRCSGRDLRELDDKTALDPGVMLLAPPDYHVLVEGRALALSLEAPIAHSRPSIDLALESAADSFTGSLVAVLLSGTGADGSNGIRHVRERGGRTLVQDPGSAEKAEMPAAAIATGAVDLVAAPHELGRHLGALVTPSGSGV